MTHYMIIQRRVFLLLSVLFALEVISLFVLFFHPLRKHFTDMETSPLPEKCSTLIFGRHSWSQSIEGSLAFHTYCNKMHPISQSSFRTCDTCTYSQAFSSKLTLPVFTTKVLGYRGSNPDLLLRGTEPPRHLQKYSQDE